MFTIRSLRLFAIPVLLIASACQPARRTDEPSSGTRAKAPSETAAAITAPTPRIITARMFDARFPEGDSNYKCLFKASDGKLYYAICCHRIDTHTQMYTFDPATARVSHLADVGELVGEKGKRIIPQGKIHVNIFEHKGKLYTASHIGYYLPAASVETPGAVEGYLPYQGGHFLSYDLATGKFEDLAKAPVEEGIITMMMDKQRERLYGLTWPSGLFIYYDLPTKTFKNLGPVFYKGERGDKEKGEWMFLCRTFGLDPRDGSVYWSNTRGEIMAYRYDADKVDLLTANLLNEKFGEPSLWRQIVWYPKEEVFYGVHMTSAWLFRFDPRTGTVEPLEMFAPDEYRAAGKAVHDPHRPGATLALHLGPDGETIYYLGQGPAPEGMKIRGTVHFLTYNIPTRTFKDHGALRLTDGRYPTYAQAIDEDNGMIYSVPWIDVPDDGSKRSNEVRQARVGNITQAKGAALNEINLICFPDPFLMGK